MNTPSGTSDALPESLPESDYLILDLGKQKGKKIKRMRKGKGVLMGAVQETLAGLRTSGALDTATKPVIVIVREKAKKRKGLRFF